MISRAIALVMLAALLFSLAGGLAPANATWVADGNPVANTTTHEGNSRCVPDGAGGAVFVWYGAMWNTYAQRLDRDGTRLWATSGVNVTPYSGDHYNPQPASDAAGGAIIAWQDSRTTTWSIYAQRIRNDGTLAWAGNGVAVCTASGNHIAQQIIPDGTGGAIIAWQDGRGGSAYNVYAQRLDASGTPLWPTNGVAVCTATGVQSYISLVTDGAGGAIITWQDARTTYYDVYAQRVSAAGTPLWATDGVVVSAAAQYQGTPKAVSDGAGGAVITWTDQRSGSWDIYAQRVNAGGTCLWTADGVAISMAYSSQTGPQLTTDGAGGAIIVWSDDRTVGTPDIYARRVSADGTPMWAADGVALCTAMYSQGGPLILSDGAGGAIVAWNDWRNYSSMDIYAQRVSGDGTPAWAANGVALCTNTAGQTARDVVSDGAGGAIVVWDDARQGSSTSAVYATHVNAWGTSEPIATAFAAASAAVEDGCVALSWRTMEDAAPASFTVERAETEDGDYIAVATAVSRESRGAFSCRDCSAEAGRTYWYKIVFSGAASEAVSEPMKVTLGSAVPAFALHQCYPNPFNPSCTITYELPAAGRVNLSIYDVRGALVATLVDGWRGEGAHREIWNGSSDHGEVMPSSMYFYRLSYAKYEATRKMVLIR